MLVPPLDQSVQSGSLPRGKRTPARPASLLPKALIRFMLRRSCGLRSPVARAAAVALAIVLEIGGVRAQSPRPPRVVAAWPAGPLEARLGFDGPVDASLAARLVG